MKPNPLLSAALLLALLLPGPLRAADGDPALIPGRYAAWWKLGEPVTFRVAEAGFPPKLSSLEGKVSDSDGKPVADVTATRAQLQDAGWTWKPEQPGFYRIAFSYVSDGSPDPVPLKGHYVRNAQNISGKTVAAFEYDKDRYDVVVAGRAPSPDYQRGQFGFTFYGPKAIPLAQIMGFDFAFIQAITWGGSWWDKKSVIEPAKGEGYHWDDPDMRINSLAKAGFGIAGQFLYIPTWASPHPEQQDIHICTRQANCYAPVDMADWDRFIRAAVARYKDKVKVWEIWNEASMPDQSVFWYDTPENYVKLLQTGYKAVKETDPGAQVWLSGLGPRAGYFEFYKRILALGASPYYDVLSLHGTWNSPEQFHELEDKAGAPHKPAVMSEWHAILHNMDEAGPHPTEQALARREILDLLYQFKQGIERSVTFVLSNESGYEPEAKDFLRKNGLWGQSYGLFRTRPRLEPRFPALVLQNFLALVGNHAAYAGEYDLGGGASGVLLDTAHGKVLAVWLDRDRPLKGLLPAGVAASVASDWEGRDVPAGGDAMLAADRIYYFSGLSGTWPQQKEVLTSPRAKKAKTGAVLQGVANAAPLFRDVRGGSPADGVAWNEKGWAYRGLLSPQQPKGFSARFALGTTADGVDVAVDVTDSVHLQEGKAPEFWNGDSVQFAFDCDGSGLPGGNTEFTAALTPRGPEIWKLSAAQIGGDLPAKWTPSNAPVANAAVAVERRGDRTLYRIRIPWSELYPLVAQAGKPLRFSILVNDNDDGGRLGYLEWSGGIGDGKDPSAYGILK